MANLQNTHMQEELLRIVHGDVLRWDIPQLLEEMQERTLWANGGQQQEQEQQQQQGNEVVELSPHPLQQQQLQGAELQGQQEHEVSAIGAHKSTQTHTRTHTRTHTYKHTYTHKHLKHIYLQVDAQGDAASLLPRRTKRLRPHGIGLKKYRWVRGQCKNREWLCKKRKGKDTCGQKKIERTF